MQLTLTRKAGTPPRAPGLPASVVVRPIQQADLEAVGRLYWASYPEGEVGDVADATADVRSSWDGEYGTWLHQASLLAEKNGSPIAAILTVDGPPWDDVSDLIFIIDLFTDPTHRRCGVGEMLVAAALSGLDPAPVVGLRVESDNEPAVRLYRKLGFRDRT